MILDDNQNIFFSFAWGLEYNEKNSRNRKSSCRLSCDLVPDYDIYLNIYNRLHPLLDASQNKKTKNRKTKKKRKIAHRSFSLLIRGTYERTTISEPAIGRSNIRDQRSKFRDQRLKVQISSEK